MSAPYVIPHVWKSSLKRSFLSCLIMIAVSGIILAKESEVVVRNGVDNVSLGGTLAEPDSVASKGAVLLLSGSGSQNRDEEVFGHRPFKVLSDYLVSRGYAVLRTDDRGVGGSEGDPAQVMAADLISDARSCVSFLDSCFGGKVPVGVIGHSEGGQTAYRLASEENVPCRFIVTLAAPSWEGDSIIISQCRAMAMAMSGAWPGEPLQKRLMAIAKSDMQAEEAGPVIKDAMGEVMGEMMKYPQVQSQIERQTEVLLSPSYREMLRYNPEDDIRKVRVPWLALNGSKDLQVIPANLLTIKSQNPEVEVCELENHNHLFQQTSSGLVTEYARLGQSPSEETLCRIADWLDGIIKIF